MAYGKGMKRLNPCGDELIANAIGTKPKSILDIGCGWGTRLEFLKRQYPEAYIAGIDSDAENAEYAAKLLPACEIKCADAKNLPFDDESFDILLCECTFSLFDEPDVCLEEMLRVMRPGGRFILADLCIGDGKIHSAPDGETIKNIYSREVLESKVEEAGFILREYSDRKSDLADMAAQMIFDGSFCSCVGEKSTKMLMKLKVGYGLWIFEKGLKNNV